MNEPLSPAPLAIAPIEDGDVENVVALWQRCFLARPWNDSHADIALARRGDNSTILVGRESDKVVSTAMVGYDGHRGWVYYVAVDPDCRLSGHGRTIMAAAEEWLRARGIEKMQLMVRSDNAKVHAFYESIGYAPQDRVIFAKWLDGRDPTP